MKVNVKELVKELNGEPFLEKIVKAVDDKGNATEVVEKPVIVGKLMINALMANYRDDDKCSGEDKIKRYKLSEKIQESTDSIEISVDDISFIKKYVNKAGFSPLLYTRVHQVLEGE
tara:strand:- start:5496 stop:5843 length:348 start_codon:yes stop_codon:yes gene_type:complete